VPPRSFREIWFDQDWAGPTVEAIYTAFLVTLDAGKVLVVFAIGQALERFLGILHIDPIEIEKYSISITAQKLVSNFDYALVILFFYLLIRRVLKTRIEEDGA
jgi:hypothetical protein